MLHLTEEEMAQRLRDRALAKYYANKEARDTPEDRARICQNSMRYYNKNRDEINRKRRERDAIKRTERDTLKCSEPKL